MSYGDFNKIVNSLKECGEFAKEGTSKFNQLKDKAENGDVLSEFSYGEHLYYNEKYLESIYWLAKAFFDNRDNGRFYLSDLLMDALKKMEDKIVDIDKIGYGYEVDTPVNVVYVTGEQEYLKSISPKNGYVIAYERIGSVSNKFGTMIDKYQIITVTGTPNIQLQRYYSYMNMYSRIQYDTLIEDFEYKRNLRDETKK